MVALLFFQILSKSPWMYAAALNISYCPICFRCLTYMCPCTKLWTSKENSARSYSKLIRRFLTLPLKRILKSRTCSGLEVFWTRNHASEIRGLFFTTDCKHYIRIEFSSRPSGQMMAFAPRWSVMVPFTLVPKSIYHRGECSIAFLRRFNAFVRLHWYWSSAFSEQLVHLFVHYSI